MRSWIRNFQALKIKFHLTTYEKRKGTIFVELKKEYFLFQKLFSQMLCRRVNAREIFENMGFFFGFLKILTSKIRPAEKNVLNKNLFFSRLYSQRIFPSWFFFGEILEYTGDISRKTCSYIILGSTHLYESDSRLIPTNNAILRYPTSGVLLIRDTVYTRIIINKLIRITNFLKGAKRNNTI